MKLSIKEDPQLDETEIIIHCNMIDKDIQQLISMIRHTNYTIIGEKDGHHYTIPLEQVHYFESVDDQTFFYTKTDVYRCAKRLYEIEHELYNMRFIRISKACIVNISKLSHVRPLLDGKFEAITYNEEVLIINRHYVKKFKEAFGL